MLEEYGPHHALAEILGRWSKVDTKPLVLMFDEIDALIGDTLISVLRQLRAGYTRRPEHFPSSIILCGIRDVQNYRIHSSLDKTTITGGSIFNIKATSLRLNHFTRSEIESLYTQHTQATGQVFAASVLQQAWSLTHGQPWLVNALAYETCFVLEHGRGRNTPITVDKINQVTESFILRRETHLDQLADQLQEEKIRRVIEPILTGEILADQLNRDDVSYAIGLGLIRQEQNGAITIANTIYQEVIPRELSWDIQSGMSEQIQEYLAADGRLDISRIMVAFQQLFQEHSDYWIEHFQYKKAGAQLLLQAFLQHIVDGRGHIEREYGLGRLCTDLLILWPYGDDIQRIVIELRVLQRSLEKTIEQGLQETQQYADNCSANEGHLVIFDRSQQRSWEERLFQWKEQAGDHIILLWGM